MWDMTVRSNKRLDAFDQWCLWHILRVPFTAHVTNQEVRVHSAKPPVTQTVMLRRMRLFGHIVRSDSDEDHSPALNAGIDDPPKEWRRPRGRPRQTWLRTVENDLKQQNLGPWSARHKAYGREQWREIVETATLQQGHATWWWWCTVLSTEVLQESEIKLLVTQISLLFNKNWIVSSSGVNYSGVTVEYCQVEQKSKVVLYYA